VLNTKATTVNYGSVFGVGNGTNSATLNLDSGAQVSTRLPMGWLFPTTPH